MENARYRAMGLVFVRADSLDELQKRCKSLMRYCPEMGNMDVYDQDNNPCGKMAREIIYIPDVEVEQPSNISL